MRIGHLAFASAVLVGTACGDIQTAVNDRQPDGGDPVADGSVVQDGMSLAVPEAGTHLVTDGDSVQYFETGAPTTDAAGPCGAPCGSRSFCLASYPVDGGPSTYACVAEAVATGFGCTKSETGWTSVYCGDEETTLCAYDLFYGDLTLVICGSP